MRTPKLETALTRYGDCELLLRTAVEFNGGDYPAQSEPPIPMTDLRRMRSRIYAYRRALRNFDPVTSENYARVEISISTEVWPHLHFSLPDATPPLKFASPDGEMKAFDPFELSHAKAALEACTNQRPDPFTLSSTANARSEAESESGNGADLNALYGISEDDE